MLEGLCGNKNVIKILLFLFVNGKCYGTQLHHALQTPLTPLQKALTRLEKGGVVVSTYEGKTRLYHFNQAYPLLNELEHLLKKAYTLLSAQEKKHYLIKEFTPSVKSTMEVLLSFWEKLGGVTRLSFHAKTQRREEGGWNGKGQGGVSVKKEGSTVLIFQEKGSWKGKEKGEMSFSNVFRWTFDRQIGVISLEHLRRGSDHPVFLFHLTPSGNTTLVSVDSHLCQEDTYFGQLHKDPHSLRLNWRVIGPKKNEEIDYFYS